MSQRVHIKTYLFYVLLTCVLSFACIQSLVISFSLDYSYFVILLYTVGIVSVISILGYSRKFAIYLCVGLLGATSILTLLYALSFAWKSAAWLSAYNANVSEWLNTMLHESSRFFSWLNDYMLGKLWLNERYGYWLFIGFTVTVTLIVYLFTAWFYNYYVLIIGVLALFITQWMVGFGGNTAPFFIALFVLLVHTALYIRRRYEKRGGDNLRTDEYIRPLIPILVGLILLIYALPAPRTPLAWELFSVNISRLAGRFNDFLYVGGNGPLTIFNVEGTVSVLGGSKTTNNYEVMRIDTPYTLYLRSNSYVDYTGRAWTRSDLPGTPLSYNNVAGRYELPFIDDNIFLLSYEDKYNPAPREDCYEYFEAKVTYTGLNTHTIYNTYGVESVAYDPTEGGTRTNETLMYRNDFMLDSSLSHGRNFSYVVTAYRLKRETDEVERLLQYAHRNAFDYLMIDQKREGHIGTLFTQRQLEDWIAETNRIYETYLSVSQTVPQRVYDLAREVTRDCRTDYDRAVALEEYLSGGYTYTLTPAQHPQGTDFVDTFLFEIPEGYCTYYATAMTVMARCLGIPARYVEGYIAMPGKDATVTQKDAHSWCEVYLPGTGWIGFEPTSPFTHQSSEPVVTSHYAGGMSDSGYSLYDDYMRMMEQQMGSEYTGDMPPLELSQQATEESAPSIDLFPYIMVLLPVLVVVSIFVRAAIVRRRRYARWRHRNDNAVILDIYYFYLKLLGYVGYRLNAGETAYDFAERVDAVVYFHPVTTLTFGDVTRTFEAARYGAGDLGEAGVRDMLEVYEPLQYDVKRMMGRVRYWLYQYVLGAV